MNGSPKDLIKWLDTTGVTSATVTGAAAGDTMVFCSVSETYDLSTKANKMTLIGIHTPDRSIIQKTYPGLLMNSKFVRIVKQDVALACASAMPFSAEIIGTGATDIAPEDAFNPILYKAVSNDSMSQIEYRLMGLAVNANPPLVGSQAIVENDDVVSNAADQDDFPVYYALLSNRDGFRTANPQAGLQMRDLVPLVFEKYYNVGVNQAAPTGSSADSVTIQGTSGMTTMSPRSMRGKAHPMPKFNTTYLTSITDGNASPGSRMPNGMSDGKPYNSQVMMPDVMPVYTGMIIMPPSRSHTLYYRMVVRTTLEFTEVRPITEIASMATLAAEYYPAVYHTDYVEQSKMMDQTTGMVDVKDGDIKKIMEGA